MPDSDFIWIGGQNEQSPLWTNPRNWASQGEPQGIPAMCGEIKFGKPGSKEEDGCEQSVDPQERKELVPEPPPNP
jgi:hypothetical protein